MIWTVFRMLIISVLIYWLVQVVVWVCFVLAAEIVVMILCITWSFLKILRCYNKAQETLIVQKEYTGHVNENKETSSWDMDLWLSKDPNVNPNILRFYNTMPRDLSFDSHPPFISVLAILTLVSIRPAISALVSYSLDYFYSHVSESEVRLT